MILVGSVWNELGEAYFIFFCKIFQLGNSVLVLRCKAIALHVIYGFCIKWRVSFIISGPKSFFVLKISGERFVDSFGECSLICLFWTSHPKREMLDIYMQLWKIFISFIYSIFLSPATEHPNKRTVKKLRYYKSIHQNTSFFASI